MIILMNGEMELKLWIWGQIWLVDLEAVPLGGESGKFVVFGSIGFVDFKGLHCSDCDLFIGDDFGTDHEI
jgi:hypothetical protein